MKQTSHIRIPGTDTSVKERSNGKDMTMTATKPAKVIVALKSKPSGVHPAKQRNLDFAEEETRSSIQWPNDEQIGAICSRLRQVKKIGMENEGLGDHFSSGDLAYQVQEIIRSTDELFRKSLRVKKNAA
jgi:hypothetical protein